MIIRDVLEINVGSDNEAPRQYTAIILDTPTSVDANGDEELLLGVVYVPVEAVIYFIDKTTVRVEI